jgi:prevent-host-death family protein
MKEVPLSYLKDDVSRYLREAEKREISITRHGKPAEVLIGFESVDDGAITGWRMIRVSLKGSILIKVLPVDQTLTLCSSIHVLQIFSACSSAFSLLAKVRSGHSNLLISVTFCSGSNIKPLQDHPFCGPGTAIT